MRSKGVGEETRKLNKVVGARVIFAPLTGQYMLYFTPLALGRG